MDLTHESDVEIVEVRPAEVVTKRKTRKAQQRQASEDRATRERARVRFWARRAREEAERLELSHTLHLFRVKAVSTVVGRGLCSVGADLQDVIKREVWRFISSAPATPTYTCVERLALTSMPRIGEDIGSMIFTTIRPGEKLKSLGVPFHYVPLGGSTPVLRVRVECPTGVHRGQGGYVTIASGNVYLKLDQ
jgi:hypothetical protein